MLALVKSDEVLEGSKIISNLCLLIKIFPVYKENSLIQRRNIHKEIDVYTRKHLSVVDHLDR